MNRVFITGMGISCANGQNVPAFWDNCSNLRTGLRVIEPWKHLDVRIAGLVDTECFTEAEKEEFQRTEVRRRIFTRQALWEAIRQAELDLKAYEEMALYLGIDHYICDRALLECLIHMYPQGQGEDRWENFDLGHCADRAMRLLLRKDPVVANLYEHYLCGFQSFMERFIRREIKLPGVSRMINNLCVSSGQSVGEAMLAIQCGEQEIILAGGLEEYAFISAYTFSKLGVYVNAESPSMACIPFDERRRGTVLGEGAGFFVLESEAHMQKRGIKPIAEILGYGTTNNLYHVTNSPPDGEGLARCMQIALDHAKMRPEQIDLVVAHGTGTYVNDLSESAAINRVFDHRPPVHSLKSYVGHTLSAAGILNCISGVLEMQNSFLLPTLFLEKPAANCNINHIHKKGQEGKVNAFISNSAGFGGFNASLVIGRS